MAQKLIELAGLVALIGWAAIGWVLWGRAARSAGTGRLQLLGWLLGL